MVRFNILTKQRISKYERKYLLCVNPVLCRNVILGHCKALLEIKKSLRDDGNVLCEWIDDSASSDHCSWRGVTCDNVTLDVVALNLSHLNLGGEISQAIGDLKSLESIDVRSNNLTGSIPDNIGNCTSFAILDLSYNQLTGKIPFNIGFLQVATLSLQGNKLTGKIPEVVGLMQALAVLDLSGNQLTGKIPPILGNLTYTGKLYLHSNNLTGSIPPELGNMTKLSYLQLNGNQLTGRIPPELGKLDELFELNLANNNLEGPIPENLSSCIALNYFNVHGNHLNGTIPLKFERLESLTYVNLSSNKVKGIIPVELGHLINLDTLDLPNNDFYGPILASIGDLEHLLKLNLSGNRLNGLLPAEFGNLRSIVDIDLSNNKLSGSIPQELGQLQNLVSLILNNNSLRGEIPSQLTNCFSLTLLNLSYNNLSGDIPAIKNFSRFPPESFLGNPGLCGNWIGALCGRYSHQRKASMSRATIVCITLGSIALLCMIIVAVYRSNQPKQFIKGSNKTVQGPPKLVILHMDMAIHTYDDIMRLTGLWDLLHGPSKKVKLDWDTRLKIAVGAAQGLAYLHHDCNPRIIHRDVKTSNILVDENFEAHLSDFGIAKSISSAKTHTSTYVMGTIGYIDPEYARTSRLNEKSDVYSFGIVLLELLTGRKAVENDANLHQLILSKADNNTVMEAVDPEVSITCIDLGLVRKTFQLALLCAKKQPSDRPTMQEVSGVLLSLIPVPASKKNSSIKIIFKILLLL